MVKRCITGILAPIFVLNCATASEVPHPQDGFFQGEFQRLSRGSMVQGPLVLLSSGIEVAYVGLDVKPDAIFYLGSASRHFVAISILKLYSEGRIDLDLPVSNYLDLGLNAGVLRQVPVRSLLMQNTGMLQNGENCSDRLRKGAPKPRAFLKCYADKSIGTPDTSGPSYYDQGYYYLLAMVIEAITQQPLRDYVREHLFLPFGLNSTGMGPIPEALTSRLAPMKFGFDGQVNGYQEVFGLNGLLFGRAGPASRFYSTAPELARWMDSVVNGALLSDKAKVLMLESVHLDYVVGGFIVSFDSQNRPIYEMNGDDGGVGYTTRAALIPHEERIVVGLSSICEQYSNLASLYDFEIGLSKQVDTPQEGLCGIEELNSIQYLFLKIIKAVSFGFRWVVTGLVALLVLCGLYFLSRRRHLPSLTVHWWPVTVFMVSYVGVFEYAFDWWGHTVARLLFLALLAGIVGACFVFSCFLGPSRGNYFAWLEDCIMLFAWQTATLLALHPYRDFDPGVFGMGALLFCLGLIVHHRHFVGFRFKKHLTDYMISGQLRKTAALLIWALSTYLSYERFYLFGIIPFLVALYFTLNSLVRSFTAKNSASG